MMMAISDEQRLQIEALIREDQLTSEQIAAKLGGISRQQVAAVKAWITIREGKGDGPTEAEAEELIESAGITFGLERDLQLALRANIEQLEPGLQIADEGKERIVSFGDNAQGRIDICARDRYGAIVVIELKAGKAAPEALTQLLAYMGAMASPSEKQVRGILIASDFHQKIIYGASAVQNVQLRRYSFIFSFNEIVKGAVSAAP